MSSPLSSLIMLIASVLIQGLTIATLWELFVAQPWRLPTMSIAQGYGISLLVYAFFASLDLDLEQVENKPGWQRSAKLIVVDLILLVLGFVVHLFM